MSIAKNFFDYNNLENNLAIAKKLKNKRICVRYVKILKKSILLQEIDNIGISVQGAHLFDSSITI